jgi:hypothetical protein
MTDLEEIQDYWTTKYPRVMVNLWSNKEGDKFFGKMTTVDNSTDLFSSTLGDLISQGEIFLRSIR